MSLPASSRALPVLRIEWCDPARLAASSRAAKAHPREQVLALAESIAAFGLDQPLVADAGGVLIKGHGRLLAARQLGLRQVPVLVRQDLDAEECRLARLADNRCAESHWLPGPLAAELAGLQALRPGLLQACGFSREQVQGLIQAEPPPVTPLRAYADARGGLERQCPHCGGGIAG